MRSGAEVARKAHNLEVGGSIPSSATEHRISSVQLGRSQWFAMNAGSSPARAYYIGMAMAKSVKRSVAKKM